MRSLACVSVVACVARSYARVQATVGVGTVLIWDFGVAYTRGGGRIVAEGSQNCTHCLCYGAPTFPFYISDPRQNWATLTEKNPIGAHSRTRKK